jgi:hypothetical protein
MKNLIESNIYEPQGKVLIIGSCLPFMQPVGYKKLAADYDMIFSVCLEEVHINMIITKICGMLSTGNISSLTFASVDKSPHCVQLHYIRNEIERLMDKSKIVPIYNFVIVDNIPFLIDKKVISLSKNLIEISSLLEKEK